jgi:hypothetical protein
MAEQSEELKLKRITIKTESGTKWFEDPDKLLAWVQQQQQLYAFHGAHSQRYQLQQDISKFDQSWSALQQQITQGLRRFKSEPENYNSRVDKFSADFNAYLEKKELFTEEAPFNKFLQRQAKKCPEFGLAALAVALDLNVSQIDRKMMLGLQEAEAYFAGNQARVKDEAESLNQFKERWDEELTTNRNSWVSEYQVKIEESASQNQKVSGLIEQWERQTESQTADLNSHKSEFKSKFDDEIANAIR